MAVDEATYFLECLPELILPVELAHGVRRKGDEVRGYAEKQYRMLHVVSQYLTKAVQVVLERLDQPGFRV